MIVITAPTGQIGCQLLENIIDSDESIRVIVRDPDRLDPKVRARAEVVEGSHSDSAVVTRAFAGADSVFWLLPPDPSVENLDDYFLGFTRPACEAFTRQGVKRVVAVSTLGRNIATNAGQISSSLAMDALIERTGVNYRSLEMPSFMDNLLNQTRSLKTQGTFSSTNLPDKRVPSCATRDIATVAAKLLLDHSWTGQEGVPVLGPENLSPNDMAHIMSEVFERPIRYQRLPPDAYKARMMQYGMSDAWAQGLVDMFAEVDRGIYDSAIRTSETASPTSFRRWCEEVLKPAVLA